VSQETGWYVKPSTGFEQGFAVLTRFLCFFYRQLCHMHISPIRGMNPSAIFWRLVLSAWPILADYSHALTDKPNIFAPSCYRDSFDPTPCLNGTGNTLPPLFWPQSAVKRPETRALFSIRGRSLARQPHDLIDYLSDDLMALSSPW